MKDKIIGELHRIREQNYEETKDLPLDERWERIHRGAEEFKKRIDRARQERENSTEISKTN